MNIELKDYFAAKAMQGMLSHNPKTPFQHLVMISYHIAEKMIEHKNELASQKYIKGSNQINIDNVENL